MADPVTVEAHRVYGEDVLDLVGKEGVKVNSPEGPVEAVGQDVKITSQDNAKTGATGRVDIDAVDQARINSGKKVRLQAPVIDFVAQAVIVRPTPNDPEKADLRAGMIWFHEGTQTWRGFAGGKIRTLKFI